MAYIPTSKADVGFCVCLTCKGGTMGDGHEGNQSRWITLHAKKKECSEAHVVALEALKLKMTTPHSDSSTTSVVTSSISSPDSVTLSMFWEECKKNKKMRPFVEDLEKQLTPEHDDPEEEPFVFNAKDACEHAIINASIFQKEFTKKKEEYSELEYIRDDLQRQITQLGLRTSFLEQSLATQKNISNEYAERLAMLETELGIYKAKYPDPINVE
jgi:hypothetical protein